MADKPVIKRHSLAASDRTHTKAALMALLVTLIWSTSWILMKRGLDTMPPITFSGLRFGVAFLCLLPFTLGRREHRIALRGITRRQWSVLFTLGFALYFATQVAQYIALDVLPATTVSLLMNLSPILIALSGTALNAEPPGRLQWAGILISSAGLLIYFLPVSFAGGHGFALVMAGVALLANASAALMGRKVNQRATLSPMVVTFTTMGIGALLTLLVGVGVEGIPPISGSNWLLVGWLAVVNSALAFTIWNRSLQTLSAVESSMIYSSIIPLIAVQAWWLLGEPMTPKIILGIVLVCLGVLLVQIAGGISRSRALRAVIAPPAETMPQEEIRATG